MIGSLVSRLKAAEKQAPALAQPARAGADPSAYQTDPVGYARDVLKVTFTDAQAEIARACQIAPYRIKANSGHNVGKTFLAAALVNWWYDSFDPGVCITTAPTERDVIDLLWTEVRLQRQRAGLRMDFIGARAPEMRTSDEHYAKGYTARKGESFQGRHRERMLFIFDEAEGVEAGYWTTAKSMFKPEPGNCWFVIGNPTTNTSQSALEDLATNPDGNPSWRIFTLSALDHPNVRRGLEGLPPVVPTAVTVEQADQWIQDWCDPVPDGEHIATDIEWRPGSGRYYRPGPIGESRILGLRPSEGTFGVWSAALWQRAETADLAWHQDEMPVIGCDVARYGDDWTAIHVRSGPCSLEHEAHNGWSVVKTADRLAGLAEHWAGIVTAARNPRAAPVPKEAVRLIVEDDGVGGGVVDLLRSRGLSVTAVTAGSQALRMDKYPNKRSELWFGLAERARAGRLSFVRLAREVRNRLRAQAMAPEWEPDNQGRRKVEKKEDTKEKVGRSPDDMDAANLAYYEIPAAGPTVAPLGQTKPLDDRSPYRRG